MIKTNKYVISSFIDLLESFFHLTNQESLIINSNKKLHKLKIKKITSIMVLICFIISVIGQVNASYINYAYNSDKDSPYKSNNKILSIEKINENKSVVDYYSSFGKDTGLDKKETNLKSTLDQNFNKKNDVKSFSQSTTQIKMRSNSINSLMSSSNPISINGNADFANQASINSWPGSGIASDPYIIENVEITTSLSSINAISIQNTNVYFLIRNSILQATGTSGSGIYLKNVQNAIIENATAVNNTNQGFYLFNSSYNTFKNNFAYLNKYNGFFIYSTSKNNSFLNNIAENNTLGGFTVLTSSANNSFSNNIGYNNSDGFVSDSSFTYYFNNTANFNSNSGFTLSNSQSSIIYNTFLNNTADYNKIYGYYLYKSRNNTIISNIGNFNGQYGFYFSLSLYNYISNNEGSHNSQTGIFWTSSNYNFILKNNASYNLIEGFHLDYSNSNNMTSDIAKNNSQYGFYLIGSTKNNFTLNLASNNGNGFYFFLLANNNTLNSNIAKNNLNGFLVINGARYNILNSNFATNNNQTGFYDYTGYYNNYTNNTASYNVKGFDFESTGFFNNLSFNEAKYNTYGFYLGQASISNLINNSADNNMQGYFLYQCNSNILSFNKANNNTNGFYLSYASSNSLISNIANYNANASILISSSSSNVITNNSFISGGLVLSCIFISSCTNNIVNGNTVNNKKDLFIQNEYNPTISINAGQIILLNISYLEIKDQVILNTFYGIQLYFCHNITLTNNTLNENNIGLFVSNSVNIIIVSNTANNNLLYGYALQNSNNSLFNLNLANNDIIDGFFFFGSNFNDIEKNNATFNNENGFEFRYSNENIIIYNQVNNNTISGYYFFNSNFNNIESNLINSNYYGIFLDSSSEYNQIFQESMSYNILAGIYIFKSNNNYLELNTVKYSLYGFYINTSQDYNDIINNSAYNCYGGYYISYSSFINLTSNFGQGNSYSAFYLFVSDNILLNNNSGLNNTSGFYIKNSTSNTLTYNILHFNVNGIELDNSNLTTITNNNINNNQQGINLFSYSTNNNIKNNSLLNDSPGNNVKIGIYLGYTTNNTMQFNNISNVRWGFEIMNSDRNIFNQNNLTNIQICFYLGGSSAYDLIENNLAFNCTQTNMIVILSPYSSYYNISNPQLIYSIPKFAYVIEITTIYIDGSANQTSLPSNIFLTTLTDGEHNVTIELMANTNIFLQQVLFTIDTTAPIIDLTGPSQGFINKSLVYLQYNIIEANINYSLIYFDSVVNTSSRQTGYLFNFLSEGQHNITIVVVDFSGHLTKKSVIFIIDTLNPTIIINTPISNFINQSYINISFSIIEPNINKEIWYIDSVANTSIILNNYYVSSLHEGFHNITVIITDLAGNTAKKSILFNVDTIEPIIILTSPNKAFLNKNSFILSYSIIELNVQSTIIYFDSVANSSIRENGYTFLSLDDGPHNLTILVTDLAGHKVFQSIIFNIDTKAPIVTITTGFPGNNAILKSNTLLNFSISDDNIATVYYSWSLNGAKENFATNYSLNLPSPDGVKILFIMAGDKAGNWNNLTFTFTTDDTPPVMTVNGINDNDHLSGTHLLTITPIDLNGIAKVEIKLNSQLLTTLTESPYTYQFDSSSVPNGQYTFHITAYDQAGNNLTNDYQITISNNAGVSQTDFLAGGIVIIGGLGALVGGATIFRRRRQKKANESIDDLLSSYEQIDKTKKV